MGCGMSKSHLLDEGFGSRNPFHFHHKTNTPSPKLLKGSSEPSIADHHPVLQKINTAPVNLGNDNSDAMWIGSPSFRVYVQSDRTTGDEQEKQTVIGTRGGGNMICNGEVCVWRGGSNAEEHEDKHDIRGGRFRKAFQGHRVTFWHGGPWHVGHPKATRKTVGA
ncbi:hypothetical protein Hanom_Chr07g00654801 [Helianthus anomalus]